MSALALFLLSAACHSDGSDTARGGDDSTETTPYPVMAMGEWSLDFVMSDPGCKTTPPDTYMDVKKSTPETAHAWIMDYFFDCAVHQNGTLSCVPFDPSKSFLSAQIFPEKPSRARIELRTDIAIACGSDVESAVWTYDATLDP